VLRASGLTIHHIYYDFSYGDRMNIHCECPIAGYCNRHKMDKKPRQHQLCSGVADSSDCGLKYWRAWEEGKLGATAPDTPVNTPLGFCDKREVRKAAVNHIKSRIGDELHVIIKRETGVEIPCADCRKRINLLNTMTPNEVREAREITISDIVENAKRVAPALWQRLAIMAESVIDNAGLLPYNSYARSKIGAWVDEAINNGAIPTNLTERKT